MDAHEKTIQQVVSARADANIRFGDLCGLLLWLGFEMRTNGSHHVFRRQGIPEKPNLQREGSMAKTYQVRQVRQLILKYGLGGKG